MEKGLFAKQTDAVLSFDDAFKQLADDHEVLSKRNTMLQNAVDRLFAEREAMNEKVAMLESALSYSERKRHEPAMEKLADLGRKAMS